jgi:hypothetical protein
MGMMVSAGDLLTLYVGPRASSLAPMCSPPSTRKDARSPRPA